MESNQLQGQRPLTGSDHSLRAEVGAIFQERENALDRAKDALQRSLTASEEALKDRIEAGDNELLAKIESLDRLLDLQLKSLEEQTHQFQEMQQQAIQVASTEREKSAKALQSAHERAQDQADAEREKSAQALRDSLSRDIKAGDENLSLHIEQQRQQTSAALTAQKEQHVDAMAAAKEAIEKSEGSTEKRFESLNVSLNRMETRQGEFVQRELYDQGLDDGRRRADANLELIQGLLVRVAEMEARGSGEKDNASDTRSLLAIGISVVVGVGAIGVAIAGLVLGG